MANPSRFAGIGAVILVVAALGYLGVTKIQKAESESAAADTKAPPPVRPDSVGRAFDAGSAIPVVGAEVVRAPLIVWVSAPGEAAPSHQVIVTSETGGRIEKVFAKEFDMVRAGDTLVMLDTTELVFSLRQAENSLNRAQASLRNLLISDQYITDPEQRRERLEAARLSSGVVDAELSLERAKLEFAKAVTRAPISGRVANLRVSQGQRVGSGTEVLTILQMDPIRINAQVLQSEIGKVSVGNQARITFGFQSDTVYTGVVESINPMVEASTRSSRVTISVRNPNGLIVPGMTARVRLQSQTYPNRLLVPFKAILQRSDGRDMLFVYTPNADGSDGRTDWRYVALGLANDEFVEILPGTDGSQKLVEPGEIVIVEGHYTLEHNSLVRLVDRILGGRR